MYRMDSQNIGYSQPSSPSTITKFKLGIDETVTVKFITKNGIKDSDKNIRIKLIYKFDDIEKEQLPDIIKYIKSTTSTNELYVLTINSGSDSKEEFFCIKITDTNKNITYTDISDIKDIKYILLYNYKFKIISNESIFKNFSYKHEIVNGIPLIEYYNLLEKKIIILPEATTTPSYYSVGGSKKLNNNEVLSIILGKKSYDINDDTDISKKAKKWEEYIKYNLLNDKIKTNVYKKLMNSFKKNIPFMDNENEEYNIIPYKKTLIYVNIFGLPLIRSYFNRYEDVKDKLSTKIKNKIDRLLNILEHKTTFKGGYPNTGFSSGDPQSGYSSLSAYHFTGYPSGGPQTGYPSGGPQTGYPSGGLQTGYPSGGLQTGYYTGGPQTGYYTGGPQTGYPSGGLQTGYYTGGPQTGYPSGGLQAGYSYLSAYPTYTATSSQIPTGYPVIVYPNNPNTGHFIEKYLGKLQSDKSSQNYYGFEKHYDETLKPNSVQSLISHQTIENDYEIAWKINDDISYRYNGFFYMKYETDNNSLEKLTNSYRILCLNNYHKKRIANNDEKDIPHTLIVADKIKNESKIYLCDKSNLSKNINLQSDNTIIAEILNTNEKIYIFFENKLQNITEINYEPKYKNDFELLNYEIKKIIEEYKSISSNTNIKDMYVMYSKLEEETDKIIKNKDISTESYKEELKIRSNLCKIILKINTGEINEKIKHYKSMLDITINNMDKYINNSDENKNKFVNNFIINLKDIANDIIISYNKNFIYFNEKTKKSSSFFGKFF